MAMVFDDIGMGGFTPDDHYKQMTSWVAIRQFIKKTSVYSVITKLCHSSTKDPHFNYVMAQGKDRESWRYRWH